MIVGFTITNLNGHEKEAIEYIRRVCILDSPDIAENIVKSKARLNIFSLGIDLDDLRSQPFESEVIEVTNGRCLLVSIVNFNLELIYNGKLLRLVPTEYIYVSPDEVEQFTDYIRQGLVKVICEETVEEPIWILDGGWWNNSGIWINSEYWKNMPEDE